MKLIITLQKDVFQMEIHPEKETFDSNSDKTAQLKTTKQNRALFKSRVDLQTTKYYHNLSEMLISTLDNLLKRNRVDIKAIKTYKILGNMGIDSTSYKIASAFIMGLQI